MTNPREREEIYRDRENRSNNKAAIVGAAIAGLAALGVGAYFLSGGNQSKSPTTIVVPGSTPASTVVPVVPVPEKTTIIEKTREVVPAQSTPGTTVVVPVAPDGSKQPQSVQKEKTIIKETNNNTKETINNNTKEVAPASPAPAAPPTTQTESAPSTSATNPPASANPETSPQGSATNPPVGTQDATGNSSAPGAAPDSSAPGTGQPPTESAPSTP